MKSFIDQIIIWISGRSKSAEDLKEFTAVEIASSISIISNSWNTAAVRLATQHELFPGKKINMKLHVRINNEEDMTTRSSTIPQMSNAEWNKLALSRAERMAANL